MAEGGQGTHAVAIYDYIAVDEQELCIKKRERLVVLDDSSRWWKVQNVQGQSGIVPSNYLKKCKPSLLESLCKTLCRHTLANNQCNQTDMAAKEELIMETFKAVVMYNYEAKKVDEMSLTRGNVVIVQKKSGDGWWNGRKENGESGWFPSNYVKTSFENLDSNDSLEGLKQFCGKTKYVVALLNFNTSNCDELSFSENEQLEISDDIPVNGACGKGWLMGQNAQGITGLIPESYVVPVNVDPTFSCNDSTSRNSHTHDLACSTSIKKDIESEDNFSDKDWFIWKSTRAQCEQQMSKFAENGDFVVRESETNVGEYTLTLKTKQCIKHFRIKVDSGNYLIGQLKFHALDDLIDYYKKHAIYRLGNEKLFLNKAFTFNPST